MARDVKVRGQPAVCVTGWRLGPGSCGWVWVVPHSVCCIVSGGHWWSVRTQYTAPGSAANSSTWGSMAGKSNVHSMGNRLNWQHQGCAAVRCTVSHRWPARLVHLGVGGTAGLWRVRWWLAQSLTQSNSQQVLSACYFYTHMHSLYCTLWTVQPVSSAP